MEIMPTLDALLKDKGEAVEAWLAERYAEHPPFFYGSTDLRHYGHKIAPVDTNLFPGGFNNLSQEANARAAQKTKDYLHKHYDDVERILILAESHTRNTYYLENVACLRDIIAQAGYQVEVGTLNEEAAESGMLELITASERPLTEHALARDGGRLVTKAGFVPDLILVNNDFSAGVPELLRNLEQHVTPPMGMGWYRRRKSVHFAAYESLVRDFGEAFDLDHWLISAYFRNCGVVDFRKQEGLDCVATNAELVLEVLRLKYAEYGIKDDPYVFIKADSGTYGMGVMTVRSGEEVHSLNKKMRQKMDVIKEGTHNTEVIIQEGIPTIDRIDGLVAEPMIYVVGDMAVGGAYRINSDKDDRSNLNSPGMQFRRICCEGDTSEKADVTLRGCNFKVYELLARLATLAAARENY